MSEHASEQQHGDEQDESEDEDDLEVTLDTGVLFSSDSAPQPFVPSAPAVETVSETDYELKMTGEVARIVDSSATSLQTLPSVAPGSSSYLTTMRSIMIYPLDNYQIGAKDFQTSKDISISSRFARMRKNYLVEGQRRTAQGVMIVHRGGHPHILLLKIGTYFKLPGGRLKPGQDEREGLSLKLSRKLAPPVTSTFSAPKWEVDELLSTWWRPNFETFVVCLFFSSFSGLRLCLCCCDEFMLFIC